MSYFMTKSLLTGGAGVSHSIKSVNGWSRVSLSVKCSHAKMRFPRNHIEKLAVTGLTCNPKTRMVEKGSLGLDGGPNLVSKLQVPRPACL